MDVTHLTGLDLIKAGSAEGSPLMRGRGNTLLSRLPSPPPHPPPPKERNAHSSHVTLVLSEGGEE